MTIRGTGALWLLFGVLAGLVWLTTPGPETVEVASGLLDVESRGRVARLEWVEPDRRSELVRDDHGWADAEGGRVDASTIDDLLDALATVHPLTTIDVEATDATGYGFAQPRRLRLLDAQRRVLFDIEIGRRNPATTGLYVRLNGSDDVVLVGALLDWELSKLSRAAEGAGEP